MMRFPGPEIIPQSGKFARFPQKHPRPHPRNRSTARSLPFGLRDARAEDAYPSEKTAVLEASSGQNSLGAAAPRMGHAAHGKGGRRGGLLCWPAHGGSSWHRASRRLYDVASTHFVCSHITHHVFGVLVCDVLCVSSCLMRFVMLAISCFTHSSKPAPKHLKSRQNKHFYVLPAKISPLRGGEISGVNEAFLQRDFIHTSVPPGP